MRVEITARTDPREKVFQLLPAWLCDQRNGSWLVILDNAHDVSFVTDSRRTGALFDCAPICDHGAIIVTSRNKSAARAFMEDEDIVNVPRMDERHAVALLARKLGENVSRAVLSELATALEFMPLAITQAAAYLKRRGRRFSAQRYLEELQRLDGSKQGLLDYDNGDLRRDRHAANPILLTWQISFEYISQERKSAAALLSLMSLCDRQAIPESLICRLDIGQSGSDAEFEDDLEMLKGFFFIAESTDESTFEMHRLVQLATRRWLVSQGVMVRK